jgi:hypothetical protein
MRFKSNKQRKAVFAKIANKKPQIKTYVVDNLGRRVYENEKEYTTPIKRKRSVKKYVVDSFGRRIYENEDD